MSSIVNKLSRTTILLVPLCLAPTIFGFKGGEVGNGGYGVEVDGQLRLLDFAQAELFAPHIARGDLRREDDTIDELVRSKMSQLLSDDDDRIDDIVATLVDKFAGLMSLAKEIDEENTVVAILEIAAQAEWAWIDGDCLDVRDEDDEAFPQRTQLAYRMESGIRVCNHANELPEIDFYGLISHEMIYAGVAARFPVKKLNAFLYRQEFGESTRSQLNDLKDILSEYRLELNRPMQARLRQASFRYFEAGMQWENAEGTTIRMSELSRDALGMIASLKLCLDWEEGRGISIYSEFECDYDGVCRPVNDRIQSYIVIEESGDLTKYSTKNDSLEDTEFKRKR